MIKTDTTSYLKNLGDLFLKIEVSDASGKKISLDDGIEQAAVRPLAHALLQGAQHLPADRIQ